MSFLHCSWSELLHLQSLESPFGTQLPRSCSLQASCSLTMYFHNLVSGQRLKGTTTDISQVPFHVPPSFCAPCPANSSSLSSPELRPLPRQLVKTTVVCLGPTLSYYFLKSDSRQKSGLIMLLTLCISLLLDILVLIYKTTPKILSSFVVHYSGQLVQYQLES